MMRKNSVNSSFLPRFPRLETELQSLPRKRRLPLQRREVFSTSSPSPQNLNKTRTNKNQNHYLGARPQALADFLATLLRQEGSLATREVSKSHSSPLVIRKRKMAIKKKNNQLVVSSEETSLLLRSLVVHQPQALCLEDLPKKEDPCSAAHPRREVHFSEDLLRKGKSRFSADLESPRRREVLYSARRTRFLATPCQQTFLQRKLEAMRTRMTMSLITRWRPKKMSLQL